MSGPVELEGLHPEELAGALEGSGRAASVWRRLRAGLDPYDQPHPLLERRTRPVTLDLDGRAVSPCGTRKLRFALADGQRIETVLLPATRRSTVCVSTQAGCARACVFCLTATMGLRRNLTAGEIVGQVVRAVSEAREASLPPVRNLVLMGMGEPLDNLAAVRTALSILCHPATLGLGPGHVTLSTVGTTPDAIRATSDLKVRLAWSLHAVDDELRRRLVPTARYGTRALRDAFRERLAETRSGLFVEMTLVADVNDSPGHADELAEFLVPFQPHVRINLLPMNPGRDGLAPSPEAAVIAFRQRLREAGYFCAVRTARGLSANAACGQLVTSEGTS